MNRLAGIIVAVIGLVIAVLSVLKVIPGLTSTGVSLILLGGLVIGLSFVSKPETENVDRMPTGATLANIFFSPGEVFQNLRRHPRWLAATIVIAVLAGIYTNLFMYRLTPERIANYAIDKTLEMSILDENARRQIEAGRQDAIDTNKNPVIRAGQAVNSFVATTFSIAFLAAVFFLFVMAMGGQMNYWQAFSATAYAMLPVAVVRYVLSSIILFIKDPTDIHPLIGQGGIVQDNLNFLVSASNKPVLYVLLSAISLLSLYWIVLNIIGLKNAGEKVSQSTATTATLTVWLLGVVMSVVLALLFPSFLS